jgi:hypothetical protein
MKLVGVSRRPADWLRAAAATVGKMRLDARSARASRARTNREYIELLSEWLCRAQDAVGGNGFSAGYFPLGGWAAAYPETTGYIVPTLYDLAYAYGRRDLQTRAERAARWLLTLQLEAGAFPEGLDDGRAKRSPSVFNTGQIVFGLLRAWQETKAWEFEAAIMRAVGWLVALQDGDGSWTRFCYRGSPNTYCAMVAWATAASGLALKQDTWLGSAERYLAWMLTKHAGAGWIDAMAFETGRPAFLHTIGYTLRGLLEMAVALGDPRGRAVALGLAGRLVEELRDHNGLAGAYSHGFRRVGRYRCLTGEAQVGTALGRLALFSADETFREAFKVVNALVRDGVTVASCHLDHLGGVAGSRPFWGRYMMLRFPNWAVKFSIDSLLLEDWLEGRAELPGQSDLVVGSPSSGVRGRC